MSRIIRGIASAAAVAAIAAVVSLTTAGGAQAADNTGGVFIDSVGTNATAIEYGLL
jgi:hypothetical protein